MSHAAVCAVFAFGTGRAAPRAQVGQVCRAVRIPGRAIAKPRAGSSWHRVERAEAVAREVWVDARHALASGADHAVGPLLGPSRTKAIWHFFAGHERASRIHLPGAAIAEPVASASGFGVLSVAAQLALSFAGRVGSRLALGATGPRGWH